MKKFFIPFALAVMMASCSSQSVVTNKFKPNPSVITGSITKIERAMGGFYIVHMETKKYGNVQIHYVPSSASLLAIPVYVSKNGKLHYRK